MAKSSRVGIIGAGISGLSTAYYLQKARQDRRLDLDISLLERTDRLGGVIRTEREENLLLEAGPEGWASYKRAANQLIDELGLKPELMGSNDKIRKTYIARNGGLETIPDGMTFLAPVEPLAFWRTARISSRGKLRAFLEPIIPRSKGDLSTRAFFSRRLGKEFADELIEPFIAAIFGADFDRLSTPSALPELYRCEQKAGSLWKGLRPLAKLSLTRSVLFTLRGGMGRLPERLKETLSDVTIETGLSDLDVDRQNGPWTVRTSEGRTKSFDDLVFSCPAPATSRMLHTIQPRLSSLLDEIPYTSSNLVYLAYEKSAFSHPLNGFGFIVPDQEAEVLDACTWVNRKFDDRCPDGKVLLRCAIHDGRRERPDCTDEELVSRVHTEIGRFLGIDCSPVFHKVYRMPNSIPQLLVGHVKRVESLKSLLEDTPGLHLAASYYSGVGVPDCIQAGKTTAEQIVARLTR